MARSPLARRITGVVFIAILIVEAAILIPSYLRKESELLTNLRTTGLHWLSAAQPLLGTGADIDTYLSAVLRADQVRGIRVLGDARDDVKAQGEAITRLSGAEATTRASVETADGRRFETVYTAAETGLANDIVLRLDASHVPDLLHDYVFRIVGLVLIITAVLTLATIMAMGMTVLRPLMQIRDALAAQEGPQLIDQDSPHARRSDEIGDVYRSTIGILKRLGTSQQELAERIAQRTTELRDANAQLQEGEERFKDFAAASSDFLWETDADLRFTYFSDRFSEVLGLPAEDVLGKTLFEMREPEGEGEFWRAHLVKMKARRAFRNFTQSRVRPDGQVVHIANNGTPVFDLHGDFQGYRGSGSDVTAAKAAERAVQESDARFRAMMDNSPSYIYLKDRDGRYQWVNKHVEAGLGLSAEEIIGKTHDAFYPPELTAIYAEHDQEVIESKQAVSRESEVPEADGSIRTSLINKFPILDADGEVSAIGAVIIDITDRKETEKALDAQKTILEATLEHMDEGITMFDEDNNLLASNSKVFDLLDMPAEFCHEHPNIEAWIRYNAERGEFGPGDPEDHVRERMSRLNNFEAHKVERVRPNGQVIEVRANPVPQGGTVTSYTDITERKRAEAELAEKEALLRLSLDNMDDGIFMLDSDMRYMVFNDQFVDLLELPPGAVKVGDKVADIVARLAADGYYGPGDPNVITRERVEALTNGQYVEVEGQTRGGKTLHVRKAPLSDGGAVVSLTDISQRKEAEELMRQARDEAEALARSKTDFVAVVSHEVRTPMNGVMGMARLLRDTPLDTEQSDCLNTLLSSGESLVRILDDLLDVSKLEAGRFDLEDLPFIPADIVEQSVSIMAPRAQEKGLSFTCHIAPELPDVLIGDGHRLRQVLLNLTSNAIKFTAEGFVTVVVDAEVDLDAETAALTISVADSGDGIEPDVQRRLFSPYTQAAANTARKFGGTGLGLSICRQLIELMGGGITLDSVVGTGTTFTVNVTLPIDTESDVADLRGQIAVGDKGGAVAPIEMRPLRILQVEDNPTNREVARKILGKAGHTVVDAANGLIAMELLESERFDIVLMDRHMPDMDGFETTAAIRGRKAEIGRLPVLGITAAAGKNELRACLEAGMDEVMTKPVNENQLLATIARMVEGETAAADGGFPAAATVLVIDDVPTNLQVARKQLKRLGLACVTADSAETGLERIGDVDFDAVLVDISMPGMDGLEFTRHLRQLDENAGRRTPVIAMTGHAGAQDRARFLDAGMDDCLTKPIDPAALAQALRIALADDAASVADTDGPDAEMAPVDLVQLANILGEEDDAELIAFAGRFVDYFPSLLETLEAACANEDHQALQDQAHAAKGASASASAPGLRAHLAELEEMAHVDDWDGHARRMEAIRLEFARVVDYIAARTGESQES